MNSSEIKLFNSINSYVSEIVSDWDSEAFKKVFEENIPRLVKKSVNLNKKPKSAYMYFSMDSSIRDIVKNQHPNATTTEIASKLGELWKSEKYREYCDDGENIDSKTKKRFNYKKDKVSKWFNMAEEDRKRYEESKIEISKTSPKPSSKPSSKTRPKSAYEFFCTELRPVIREDIREEMKKEMSEETFTQKELTKRVNSELQSRWEELKDRNIEDRNLEDIEGDVKKDKKGKFVYKEEANKWLDMVTNAKTN